MIDIFDKKTLENKFAEDFSSPTFPILADLYLSEGDIKRAKKVCEVGLEHCNNNTDGKFILAKIFLEEENYLETEKYLKIVVNENPAHFNGFRMLINIEIKLKRSTKTIKKFIDHLLRFIPNDTECKNWLKELNIPIKNIVPQDSQPAKINQEKNVEKKPKLNESLDIKTTKPKPEIYNVDESMATFTMVQVLKSQNHYNQALAVLNVLESMGRDKKKIDIEKEKIYKYLSESIK